MTLVVVLRQALRQDGFFIRQLREQVLDNQEYVLVRGMPQDRMLPKTPSDGLQPPSDSSDSRDSCIVENAHLGLCGQLGEVYTFGLEKGFRILHSVAGVKGNEQKKGSTGSTEGFNLHQEARAHPLCPDVLVLSCVRHDVEEKAVTSVVSFLDVAPELLKPENADMLRELQARLMQLTMHGYFTHSFCFCHTQKPNFVINPPESYQAGGFTASLQTPALAFDGHFVKLAINMNGMRALNAHAKTALRWLMLLFKHHATPIKLRAGDALVLNNAGVLHTRSTAFKVRGDGTDRWLLRSFVRSNHNCHENHGVKLDGRIQTEWPTRHHATAGRDIDLFAFHSL